MSIITIKAASGSYVGVDAEGVVTAVGDSRQLFALTELDEGKVALMPMALTGIYLQAASGGGLAATSGEIGASARFTLVETEGATALQSPNGIQYLSEAEDGSVQFSGTTVGERESFVITTHDPSVLRGGHCCGQRPSVLSDGKPEPVWEEETHKGILTKALDLMGPHQGNPEVAHAIGVLANPHVRDLVWRGLYDADHLPEYTGIDYSPHFYDPDVDRNFRHPWPFENPNARTEGMRYFNISAGLLANILWKVDNQINVDKADYNNCGYFLGVACHYLTDLTQPMHAANFANYVGRGWPILISPYDKRHSDFEENAERQVKAGYLNNVPWLPGEIFQIPAGTGPADLLEETARHSKKVFEDDLEKITDKKLRWDPQCRCFVLVPYTDAEVKKILDLTLKGPSLQAAARFFTLWWRIANQQRRGMDGTRWFRIKESTKSQYLRRADKWIHRWKLEANNDDFLHTFRRNRDGSYAIVCKARLNQVWTKVAIGLRPDVNPTELKSLNGTTPDQRYLPVLNGKTLWIYNRRDALRIREGLDWDGHLVTWTPDVDKPHKFELEDAGPISAAEAEELARLGDSE